VAGVINRIKLYPLVLYFSLTYALVAVVLFFSFDLKEAGIATPVNALMVAAATIIQIIFILLIYASKKKLFFFILLFTSAALNVSSAVALALLIHKYFFTILFQIITIHYIVFILKYRLVSLKRVYLKAAQITSYVFILALLVWEIVVGYFIMTRTESRWLESIFYNAYDLLLIVILCYNTIKISYMRKIKLVLKNDRIYLNDIDLNKILNEDYVSFVKAILNNKNKCYEIFNAEAKFQKNCESCLKDNLTVECCQKFGILFEKLENINKIMYFLRIGKIKIPINKDRLKYDGWKVALSRDLVVKNDEI
jgi:hypothetical protein